MYNSINFLKKLNYDNYKYLKVYKRYQNIFKKKYSNTTLLIIRGIFPVVYQNKQFNRKYKFGMFSFTRKPFARPLKKTKNKKR